MRRTLLTVYALALAAVSFCLLLWPGFELTRALLDRNLGGPEPAAQGLALASGTGAGVRGLGA
ncbi:hypothetical protein [Aquimonas sp.]|jgi:hypothetical protein|uniref:hypothetical protein n=1 Tax=Aquimonas sp. TaxID=1872588 RepID=UPI0037C06D8A